MRPRRRKLPWWKRKYYAVWGFWHEWSPRMLYRKAKGFVQRGSRGWADRDIWSLDTYVAAWMPAALRHLKATKHGLPLSVFTESELDAMSKGDHDHVDSDAAAARWDATLDKIIAGFEAYNRMEEGLYESELGPYPDCGWRQAAAVARFEASQKLQARDEALWKEGAALFIEHFGSLWD